MTTQGPSNLYAQTFGTTSTSGLITYTDIRDPTPQDVNFPALKYWLNVTSGSLWILESFSSMGGFISAKWVEVSSGPTPTITLTGNSGGPISAISDNFNLLGDVTTILTAGTPGTLTFSVSGGVVKQLTADSGSASPSGGVIDLAGGTGIMTSGATNVLTVSVSGSVPLMFPTDSGTAVASGNTLDIMGGSGITVSAAGDVITITSTASSVNYTSVDFAMSPYTVLNTDYYLSVDSSGGAVVLNFPNAPTFKQIWIVKDRTGHAGANNITLTTPGGADLFDGAASYVMDVNYQAVNLIANATPAYEIF